ncbi:MAG: helix-hairpin-helix domain-containing protein [Promethearchaeota archaeon]
MEHKLEDVKNVGKKTADLMRSNGIKSVEDLASIDINDLLKVRGIGESTGKMIIENAKLMLNTISKNEKKENSRLDKLNSFSSSLKPSETIKYRSEKKNYEPHKKLQKKNDFEKKIQDFKKKIPSASISKPEIKKNKEDCLVDLFSNEKIQRIQFLHNHLKQIEHNVYKNYNNFPLGDLDLFLEYINILNINYKNKNHSLIINELSLTSNYYDPASKKKIPINDIMYECARVSWILAKIYAFLSEKYQNNENFENAILLMVRASQMYKTATYFSSSAVYQEEKGLNLDPEILELNSEECRILAQSIAALREEKNNNLLLASNLYAGLNALSKRLYYLREHEKKKKWQIEAKMNYHMGKSYQMRIIAMLNLINQDKFIKESLDTIRKLHIKAYYYFTKAKDIWEKMLQNLNNLLEEEIKILKSNLTVVNTNIVETEVKNIDYNEVKDIQDCEPIIIIPEIHSLIFPKPITYLTKFPPKDVNIKRIKKFRNLFFNNYHPTNEKQDLLNLKSAIGRTIRQINILYDNNDIEIDKYVELMEKYNIRLKMIEDKIAKFNNSEKKKK